MRISGAQYSENAPGLISTLPRATDCALIAKSWNTSDLCPIALVSRFLSMLIAVSRPATDTTRGSANGLSPSSIARRSSAESESIVTKTCAS